jgi:sec-independent protein translocase protein TatA
MGIMSWGHRVVVLAVVLLPFGGRGKISGMLGEVGTGIRTFKGELRGNKRADSGRGIGCTDGQRAEFRSAAPDVRASTRTNFDPKGNQA